MGMNKLTLQKRVQILNLLMEGNSVRATARITDVADNTVANCSLMLVAPALPIKIRRFATFNVSASSSMKFGASSMPKTRTFRAPRRHRKALATCGRGLPLMPTRS